MVGVPVLGLNKTEVFRIYSLENKWSCRQGHVLVLRENFSPHSGVFCYFIKGNAVYMEETGPRVLHLCEFLRRGRTILTSHVLDRLKWFCESKLDASWETFLLITARQKQWNRATGFFCVCDHKTLAQGEVFFLVHSNWHKNHTKPHTCSTFDTHTHKHTHAKHEQKRQKQKQRNVEGTHSFVTATAWNVPDTLPYFGTEYHPANVWNQNSFGTFLVVSMQCQDRQDKRKKTSARSFSFMDEKRHLFTSCIQVSGTPPCSDLKLISMADTNQTKSAITAQLACSKPICFPLFAYSQMFSAHSCRSVSYFYGSYYPQLCLGTGYCNSGVKIFIG